MIITWKWEKWLIRWIGRKGEGRRYSERSAIRGEANKTNIRFRWRNSRILRPQEEAKGGGEGGVNTEQWLWKVRGLGKSWWLVGWDSDRDGVILKVARIEKVWKWAWFTQSAKKAKKKNMKKRKKNKKKEKNTKDIKKWENVQNENELINWLTKR